MRQTIYVINSEMYLNLYLDNISLQNCREVCNILATFCTHTRPSWLKGDWTEAMLCVWARANHACRTN